MQAAFAKADKQRTGRIEKAQLRNVLAEAGVDLAPIAFKEYSLAVFRKLEKGGNVNYEECVQFYNKVISTETTKVQKKYERPEQITSSATAFQSFDKEHSGYVERYHLKALLCRLNLEVTPPQMLQLTGITLPSGPSDGKAEPPISLGEFHIIMDKCLEDEKIRKKYQAKIEKRYAKLAAEIAATFSLLDVDENGAVGIPELVNMLEGCDFDPDQVRDVLRHHDVDQEGTITEEAFVEMAIAESLQNRAGL